MDISGQFIGQGTRVVPIGDPLKQKIVLIRESFSSEEIRETYQAWNFIDEALQSGEDKPILETCKPAREAFDHLEKWHNPQSQVATQKLHDKFHYFNIPPNSNPIEALHALLIRNTNTQMAEEGMGIPDTFLHARFFRALLDEFNHVQAIWQAMKNRDRAEIIRMVGTKYSTLPQKKGSQRSSRPPEQAFFSSESGGRSGARRGCGRSGGGTQGRGRGCSSSKGGGSNSGGGSSSSSSASGSSYGGGTIPPGRCW